MKIAIHNNPGSFSERWVTFCKMNNVSFKLVNCYDSNIVDQLEDCNGLMWHWTQLEYGTQIFARQLIIAIENMGIKVFPSSKDCWHFDDKLGQKYLLESINASMPKSYCFYAKKTALEWANRVEFPKVFKLRGGAGSTNVKLVKSRKEAKKLIHKAFGKGFPYVGKFDRLNSRIWRLKRDKDISSFLHFLKGLVRMVVNEPGFKLLPRQLGYIYFQDFIPNNKYDDRIVVVGNRAFAVRRLVRHNDFRASGSGLVSYDYRQFNLNVISDAFYLAKKIGMQSIAIDYVYDDKGRHFVVEISYCYVMGEVYDSCEGYWDSDLLWHAGSVNPQQFIIEDFLTCIEKFNNQI